MTYDSQTHDHVLDPLHDAGAITPLLHHTVHANVTVEKKLVYDHKNTQTDEKKRHMGHFLDGRDDFADSVFGHGVGVNIFDDKRHDQYVGTKLMHGDVIVEESENGQQNKRHNC